MHILFATSEAHPLIKTGGLADVSGSLPAALQKLNPDVRLVLPAYRAVLDRLDAVRVVARVAVPGVKEPLRILESRMPDSDVALWLVDAPVLFDRAGAPYSDPEGRDWPDNALRFASFCRAVVELASDRCGLGWRADVVHCNDWQTGLVPALLSLEAERPATVFTIHNLAYQGLFGREAFDALRLPERLWGIDGLEFYDNLSFIKGGIVYADHITTVSPTYAEEIRCAEYGNGLDGLLRHRADRLSGILNGVDTDSWDPAQDPYIPHHFTAAKLAGKTQNKLALQKRMGLTPRDDIPLFGLVGRLVHQKGVDLVIEALPRLLAREIQIVALGTGERELEAALKAAATRHLDQLAVHIGYSEELAHLIEAGSDLFLMPSRYEPCGLNQIYSLRYGTLPVVRRTGGLADTVVDADAKTLRAGTATGFVFDRPDADSLADAVERALAQYADPAAWQTMMRTAMAQDFTWEHSASQYLDLYRQAIADRNP